MERDKVCCLRTFCLRDMGLVLAVLAALAAAWVVMDEAMDVGYRPVKGGGVVRIGKAEFLTDEFHRPIATPVSLEAGE